MNPVDNPYWDGRRYPRPVKKRFGVTPRLQDRLAAAANLRIGLAD
jgi:hypothetical protein